MAIVTGATASGKTSLAISLAKHYGTDVISADSRQIYKDIPIGTAAPTEEERGSAYHHFVGMLPLDAYYSAAKYEEDVMSLLPDLFNKSSVAVMCGGSMMYVDAVVNGIDEMPTISESTRDYVLKMLENTGLEAVQAQLKILDPDYFEIVDKSNTRRVVHALEICLEAGMPYSHLRTGKRRERPFKVIKFAIERPRQELFGRINRRVDEMMKSGLLEEATRALDSGNFNSLNTVGYKEIASYRRGEMDLSTAIARIAKNTRVYAKKQLTWLAKDPSVIWLKPETSLETAIKIIDSMQ